MARRHCSENMTRSVGCGSFVRSLSPSHGPCATPYCQDLSLGLYVNGRSLRARAVNIGTRKSEPKHTRTRLGIVLSGVSLSDPAREWNEHIHLSLNLQFSMVEHIRFSVHYDVPLVRMHVYYVHTYVCTISTRIVRFLLCPFLDGVKPTSTRCPTSHGSEGRLPTISSRKTS